MKINTALRSAMAQQIVADIQKGTTGNPKFEFYTGTMPASIGSLIDGTLIAELEMTVTAAAEANGVITFDTISEDLAANAGGNFGFARILDRDGAEVMYLSVSGLDGGGDIELTSDSIVEGEVVSISSAKLTVGA